MRGVLKNFWRTAVEIEMLIRTHFRKSLPSHFRRYTVSWLLEPNGCHHLAGLTNVVVSAAGALNATGFDMPSDPLKLWSNRHGTSKLLQMSATNTLLRINF